MYLSFETMTARQQQQQQQQHTNMKNGCFWFGLRSEVRWKHLFIFLRAWQLNLICLRGRVNWNFGWYSSLHKWKKMLFIKFHYYSWPRHRLVSLLLLTFSFLFFCWFIIVTGDDAAAAAAAAFVSKFRIIQNHIKLRDGWIRTSSQAQPAQFVHLFQRTHI